MAGETFPLVVIVWHDHQSHDQWSSHDAAVKALQHSVIHSVGWLIHEDDLSYAIIQNVDRVSDLMCMQMRFYKGTVVSFQTIEGLQQ